eukprot:5187001-Alexandrium_andersonii.AAC.1
MGLLELAPSPEQNSKHCAPPNSDYFLSGAQNDPGKHGFSNDSLSAIAKPPDVGSVKQVRAWRERARCLSALIQAQKCEVRATGSSTDTGVARRHM